LHTNLLLRGLAAPDVSSSLAVSQERACVRLVQQKQIWGAYSRYYFQGGFDNAVIGMRR